MMKNFGKVMKAALAVTLAAAALGFAVPARAEAPPKAPAAAAAVPAKARTIEISVTDDGFKPSPIKVKKGEPLNLVVTRKTEHTCAKELVLDEGKIDAELPLNKPVEIAFTPTKTGQIKYGCAMGKMVSGLLTVE